MTKKEIKTNLKKASSGKVSSGKVSSGKVSSGKVSSGKVSSGKASSGKTSSGKTSSGKTSSGKTSSGKTSSKKKELKLHLSQKAVFNHFFSTNNELLKKVLESFIPQIDPISRIKMIKLNPPSNNPQISVLNVSVELSTGEKMNIEMQSTQEIGFLPKMLEQFMRLVYRNFKEENYKKIKTIYSIVFSSEPVEDLKEVSDYVSHFVFARTESPKEVVSDKLNMLVVELSKIPMENIKKLSKMEKWCYFIKRSGELSADEKKELSKEKELKMAIKHLESLSQGKKLITR